MHAQSQQQQQQHKPTRVTMKHTTRWRRPVQVRGRGELYHLQGQNEGNEEKGGGDEDATTHRA